MIKKVAITSQDKIEFSRLKLEAESMKDDFYDYSKVVVKKPWGYEYLIFSNESIAVWILYLKPGAMTSMHCHPNKKTSLVVLEGKVLCSTLSEKTVRQSGDGLLIEKGVFHQTETDEGAFVMEIETPINKRDLARLKDRYGRTGKGYETEDQHSFNTQNYNYLSLNNLVFEQEMKKRFGQCSLTIRRFRSESDMGDLLHLDSQDVITVLNGRLLNGNGQPTVGVGDTTTIGNLRDYEGLRMEPNTEVLLIRKIDRIVKISDYVAAFLHQHKLKTIFVVAGEANVHLLDSIGRKEGLSHYGFLRESSASFAAEAFGKLRVETAVLVVSSGESAISTLPGVANAWTDSVPLLVLSGQARTDQDFDQRVRQLGNKSINIVEMVRSITKYAVKVTEPSSIKYHLEKALHLAQAGRPGPVWLDLPIDVQGMTLDENELKEMKDAEPASLSGLFRRDRLDEVICLLKNSSRPVVLAGSGIRNARAETDFQRLIDRLKVPVLTSRRGADLMPADYSFFFGHPGTYGQRSANFIIQNCDLLLSIGSRLSIPLIGRNTEAFARAAKKVVVDIDSAELEKGTVKADLAVAADAGEFIRGLLDLLPERLPNFSSWLNRCREWEKTFPPDSYTGPSLPFENPEKDGLIHSLLLLRTLSEELDEGDVIVADGGPPLIYLLLAFRFKAGQRLICSTGLELPGFALPAAIGASVARDKRRIICLCEDQGFQVNLHELQTIVDYGLPIKTLILKSKGHSIIRNIQRDYFGGRFVGTDRQIRLGSAPLLPIVKAYNFSTFQISRSTELVSTLREWIRTSGPSICEIQLESDQEKLPRPGFTIREGQKWVAKPLEDMYPLLHRDILRQNMIIDLVQED